MTDVARALEESLAAVAAPCVAIVHHWDCDGLASAALLQQFLHDVRSPLSVIRMHPRINYYFLTDEEFTHLRRQRPDMIVTVDLNFPEEVLRQLDTIAPRVFMFDHHAQSALFKRPGKQDARYPGCSQLLGDITGRTSSLTSILGMIGDQEDRLKSFAEFFPHVETVLAAEGLTFSDALQITKLVDTLYITNHPEEFARVIDILQREPKALLLDAQLIAFQKALSQESQRILELPQTELALHVLFQHISSSMNILSEVTRQLSARHPHDTIMTVQERGEDAFLYVRRRTRSLDCRRVAEIARSKGWNAGGKEEVAGVILPVNAWQPFRDELLQIL